MREGPGTKAGAFVCGRQDDVNWFVVGERAQTVGVVGKGAGGLPPVNDIEAQRAWLGGFGAAWVADPRDGESVEEALAQVLDGRAELLRQLRSHRLGWGSRREQ
jgi:hypothetical protein